MHGIREATRGGAGRALADATRRGASRSFAGKGTLVYSRDGKLRGVASGSEHRCQLEGCGGVRVSVRWDDGRRTFPCSKGLTTRADDALQIL
jgi:hypothetical protein